MSENTTGTVNKPVIPTMETRKVHIIDVKSIYMADNDPSGKYAIVGDIDQTLALRMFFGATGLNPASVDVTVEVINWMLDITQIAKFGPGLVRQPVYGDTSFSPHDERGDIPSSSQAEMRTWKIVEPGRINLLGTEYYITHTSSAGMSPSFTARWHSDYIFGGNCSTLDACKDIVYNHLECQINYRKDLISMGIID